MTTGKSAKLQEQGIVIPYQQFDRQTLRRLVQEFVSRDGTDWNDAGGSLEEKVNHVLGQLRDGRAKVVFDLQSNSANIVPATEGDLLD